MSINNKPKEMQAPSHEYHAKEKRFDQSLAQAGSETRPSFPNVVLYRSALNDLPLVIIFLLVGGSVLGTCLILREYVPRQLFGYEPITVLSLSLITGCSIVGAVILFRRVNVRYLIADDGIEALRGIISNHQVDAKLEYYQIRGTEIHRNLFGRLIGTGDLHVRGSTSNDTEVAFKGIYDPYRYQKLIQERHRLDAPNFKAPLIDDRDRGHESLAILAQ